MANDSKTEKATPKKRKDERKKGHIPLSKDIVTVASLIGIFFSLSLLFPFIYETIRDFMLYCISLVGNVPDVKSYGFQLQEEITFTIIKAAIPILLISIALAVVATGAQTKFLFSGEKLKIKFSNLNPINGIKNMFALKNLVELLKNIVKIVILFVILFQIVEGELTAVARTIDMDIMVSAAYVLNAIMNMVYKVTIVFIAISGFDFFYQRWDFERQIKMSKEEVKEEYKQTEGNPEVKGKIREIQRQRARSRMMQAVPTADVIIRNPTHYAVALKYDLDKDNAPILVAKGQDELALRIVQIGEENGVYVMENKALARGIYASTQLGWEIPEEYYGMVAEILVYVYKLNKKMV